MINLGEDPRVLTKDRRTEETEKKGTEISAVPFSGLGVFISIFGRILPKKSGFTHQNSPK